MLVIDIPEIDFTLPPAGDIPVRNTGIFSVSTLYRYSRSPDPSVPSSRFLRRGSADDYGCAEVTLR